MIPDPFIVLFTIVFLLSLFYLLLKATPIFSESPVQKKLLLFSMDIIVTSVIFFLIIHFAKSADVYMIILYTLFYIGVIYYKSRSFITTRE